MLASDRMARALLTDFDALPHRERNLVRFMFRDETARSLYTHWDIHAHDIVASLRRDAGRHPHDPLPAEPVGELSIEDEDFRRWWADQNVRRHRHGSKQFHPPIVGPPTLDYESLTLPADPDQRLSVYTTEAGSSSEEALRLPAAWIRQPETSHGQHADLRTPAGHPRIFRPWASASRTRVRTPRAAPGPRSLP